MEKPVFFTEHAKFQMLLRGAREPEVSLALHSEKWEAAKRGRMQCRKTFAFDQIAPGNKIYYRFKTVDSIFIEEPDQIVVITVKVYYHNE